MNTKIILSIAVIGAVAAIAVGGTVAYFSDTQSSIGNTFTAGTIDISVGQTGLVPVHLDDMKPSQVGYSNFTIVNSGTNPVNVTKTIQNIQTDENEVNEPECLAYQGTWTQGQGCAGGTLKSDIDTVITYDLSVKLYSPTSSTPVWNTTLNDMDQTISQKNGQPSFLGMIPAGWHMDVVESYHMASTTGNWAQSDKMTFDIVLTGTQLTGTLVLSNKDPNRPVTDGWFVLGTKTGTLTYGVKDDTFNYTFSGTAPAANTDYVLLSIVDPWPQTGSTVLNNNIHTDATGAFNATGTTDYNKDLINAKTWLVLQSDWDGSKMIGWHPASYLFETGLMDYYDSVK
ncbi:MAG: TasA family protein [Candidatus Pacebacteria bacterium]|nr:TasA family protein [Candidatus Paceibacterota bacterium]